MTTRAGFAGLLTGLAATLILLYPLAIAWPGPYLAPSPRVWIAAVTASALAVGGGWLAGRWSGSGQPIRCAVLGALAGGLTGTLVFCLLGAAAAGLGGAAPFFGRMADSNAQVGIIAAIVRQTESTFLACFLGGIGLGFLGGWLACPHQTGQPESFNKSEPQMALNAAITAAPASVVAAALAAAVFPHLADSVGRQTDILDLSLATSLLLVLVSHFALTLVVPHEARQAEHLCGMDEVKMGAYVGIGVAPVLALLLFFVRAELFSKPLVVVALLGCALMSLKSLQTLIRLVLPGRASFQPPDGDWQKVEAKLFGTISASNGPRLVVLCIGCGLMMVLPLYVTVISVVINLYSLLIAPTFAQSAPVEAAHKLFLTQALVSTGLMSAAAATLIAIYLFYLNLGRWFNRWNSNRNR